MKNSKKVLLTIIAIIIGSIISITVINWEMLNAVYKICKIEIQLTHYLPKLEEARAIETELSNKVSSLEAQKIELEQARVTLAKNKAYNNNAITAQQAIEQ